VLNNGANGWGEIRTREGCDTPHAFQACALNHSATHPDITSTRIQPLTPAHQHPNTSKNRRQRRRSGGQGEIRTHDTGFTGMPVFETGAFSHSATCPGKTRKPSPLQRLCQRIAHARLGILRSICSPPYRRARRTWSTVLTWTWFSELGVFET
jgi:hypothetical protein